MSRADSFDACVAVAADRLRRHVGAGSGRRRDRGRGECRCCPADWDREVPLSAHLPAHRLSAHRRHPARVVVYRLPVGARVRGRVETVAFVLDLLVEEVADLIGRDPDELDPRLP